LVGGGSVIKLEDTAFVSCPSDVGDDTTPRHGGGQASSLAFQDEVDQATMAESFFDGAGGGGPQDSAIQW